MVKINFEEAKDWLERIDEKDSVAIIHHDDIDGFSSGIIFYDWCKLKKAIPKNFIFKIGKNKLSKFNLQKFNKIIITDLASNVLIGDLEKLKDKTIFYTDHHPGDEEMPDFVLEFKELERGYIPSSRTAGELTDIKKWLAIIGTVSDSGDLYEENKEYINKFLNEERITLEELKKNGTNILMNTLTFFQENKTEFFNILQGIEDYKKILDLKKYSDIIEIEIKKWVDRFEEKKESLGGAWFFYFGPKYNVRKQVSAIISRKYPEKILIFANPSEETICISARNQSRKKDMSKLLKEVTRNFEDSIAGGHVPAAGATIQKRDLEKFKENIRTHFKDS